MEVEVGLWYSHSADEMSWQPYRPPVQFDGLGVFGCYFVIYRCGDVEITGSFVSADDGRIVVEEQKIVAEFISDLATYPVFVPADGEDYLTLVEAASDRGIPHRCFENGIGFVSASQAVQAKLAMT